MPKHTISTVQYSRRHHGNPEIVCLIEACICRFVHAAGAESTYQLLCAQHNFNRLLFCQVLCPPSCLNLGSFATVMNLNSSCLCGSATLSTMLSIATSARESSAIALVSSCVSSNLSLVHAATNQSIAADAAVAAAMMSINKLEFRVPDNPCTVCLCDCREVLRPCTLPAPYCS